MSARGLGTDARARRRTYLGLARAFAPPTAPVHAGRSGRGAEARDDRVAEEYTRLFVAPRPLVYPYESMYEPVPRVMGEPALDARARYAAAGFSPSGWRDLPDHVALELAFMAALAAEEGRARSAREPARLARAIRTQIGFLEDHLIRWVPRFCEDVEAESRLPFYRAAAGSLRGFIPRDLDLVASTAASLPAEGR